MAVTAELSCACSHCTPLATRTSASHRSPRHMTCCQPAHTMQHAIHGSTCDGQLCTVLHATILMACGAKRTARQRAQHAIQYATVSEAQACGAQLCPTNVKRNSGQRWHCSLRLCCRRIWPPFGGTLRIAFSMRMTSPSAAAPAAGQRAQSTGQQPVQGGPVADGTSKRRC